MTDKPETQRGPKLQKFSLTQLGWENPCCLRHPILQANQREKFVYFASQVDELKSAYQELQKQAEALNEVLKSAERYLEGQILYRHAYVENLSGIVEQKLIPTYSKEILDKVAAQVAAHEKWKDGK